MICIRGYFRRDSDRWETFRNNRAFKINMPDKNGSYSRPEKDREIRKRGKESAQKMGYSVAPLLTTHNSRNVQSRQAPLFHR